MAKLITKQRRGLTSEWLNTTQIPEDGELILEVCEVCARTEDCIRAQNETPNTKMCPNCKLHLDTTISEKKIKIGNGISSFIELPYVDEIVRNDTTRIETRLSEHIQFNNDEAHYGEGTPESELIDARVSYEGITYNTAGDAIRSVGEEIYGLKTSLADFINAQAVDGLYYEGNKLYLTASGVILEDSAVEIISGSGSGGGGTVSSSIMSLKNADGTNSFTVVSGEKIYLNFIFTSVEASDETISTGNGSCTVKVDGATKSTFNIPQGRYPLEISQWLKSGENKIEIEVTDVYGAYRKLVYFISVIELIISSTFNPAERFVGNIDFLYKAIGTVDKVAHFRLKGPEDADYVEVATSAVIKTTNTTNSQIIPRSQSSKPQHAVYSLDVYLTGTVGTDIVSSNHLTYDVMFIMEGTDYDPLLASSYSITEVNQGDLISIPYCLYDPAADNCDSVLFTITNNGETFSSITANDIDRTQHYWNITNYPKGNNVKFTISYTSDKGCTVTKTHTIKVNESVIDVNAETTSMQLYLTAQNRTNNDANRDQWISIDNTNPEIEYTSILTGFNWQTNGWMNDKYDSKGNAIGDPCLRLNGNARATINFTPFNEDFTSAGKTIELDFAIRNVNDRDAVAISCWDINESGLYATADKLRFRSGGVDLNCSYKDEERLRVSIVIETPNAEQDSKFAKIYLNGVLSGISEYAGGFTQNNPLPIQIGTALCEIDIYNIRIYKRALTDTQIIHNYIYDLNNMTQKISEFNANDIYNNITEELDYNKVKKLIPTVTFIGKLPRTKGDKKKNNVRMIFEHPTNANLNIDEILKELDVQGTSSAGYPRKNWKTKHNNKITHMSGQIAAKTFCLKVDYAEGTGTHNTQNANLVETFYSEPIPVKQNVPSLLNNLSKDEVQKIRTTITGYPIAIFHLDTDDWNLINIPKEELAARTDIKFYSKGNFNYDKGAEDVFGFNDDCDVECWEFLNNSTTTSFLTEWPEDYTKYWEARYHPDLEELEDADEKGDSAKVAQLQESMIQRFKEMYNWVHSTARGTYTNKDTGETTTFATGAELSEPYIYNSVTYTHDTDEYRLAKFKNEFENYFNLHYSLVYYVYTFFALMVDQRAKNLFLTYWHDDAYNKDTENNPGKWYPYFYDNDTSYGINNTGHLTYDYYHEDYSCTDPSDKFFNDGNGLIGNAEVYNGQFSVLWNNIREAFPEKIQETYSNLRSSGKLSFNSIVDTFITNGSSQWSASIYNEDAWSKYISIGTKLSDYNNDEDPEPDIVKEYFYQVRGDGEQHLKYFVENRIKYCDSRWHCGNYAEDRVTVRIYDVNNTNGENPKVDESLNVVPSNSSITVKPYSNMYCGVSYGAASGTNAMQYLQQQYCAKGDTVTFHSPDSDLNDRETYIYGASELSSIGDLAPLYPKLVAISAAEKLVELKVGDKNPAYYNANLESVSVGSNKLLKYIDVSNCPNFGTKDMTVFDVSKCTNIEEIYASGTSLLSITLPVGGNVTHIHYPETINRLEVRNQLFIDELKIGSHNPNDINCESTTDFNKIQRLWLENTNLDNTVILNNILNNQPETGYALNFIRIDGFDQTFTSIDDKTGGDLAIEYLSRLMGRGGLDAEGKDEVGKVYLMGTIRIDNLTGAQYDEIHNNFPYLTIEFNRLVSTVTFMGLTGEDGITPFIETINNPEVEGAEVVLTGRTIRNPIDLYNVTVPTKEEDAQYIYTFDSWSRIENSTTRDPDALKFILGNRTLYPVFNATTKQYKVSFYTGSKLIYFIYQAYGDVVKYDTARALQQAEPGIVNADGYPIKQDTTVSNMYKFTDFIPSIDSEYKITGDINFYADFVFETDELAEAIINEFVYEQNDSNNTLSLKKYIAVPNDEETDNNDNDAVINIKETYNVSDENNDITPYTVISVGGFTPGISEINGQEYDTAVSVEYVLLPNTITKIEDNCFNGCIKLIEMTIPEDVTSIGNNSFTGCNSLNKFTYNAKNAQDLSGSSVAPLLNSNSSHGINIVIGKNVTSIPSYLFYNGSNLDSSPLVSSITWELNDNEESSCIRIGDFAFRNCTASNVKLPQSINTLNPYSFANNNIHKNISYIDGGTFTVPNVINTLGTSVFNNWSELESIRFNKVNNITGAFASECPKLKEIKIDDDTGNFYTAGNCVINRQNNVIIQGCTTSNVPSDLNNAIIGSSAFKSTNIVINDSTECEERILPKNIKEIRSYAFQNCDKIKVIVIPPNVTKIEQQTFDSCTSLESINLNNVTEIDAYAFWHCQALNNVTIPSGVSEISENCFRECKSLNTITIPNSVVKFKFYSFRDTGFNSFTVPENIIEIGAESFMSCKNLTEFTFNNNIQTVGGATSNSENTTTSFNIFSDCSNLKIINCEFNSDKILYSNGDIIKTAEEYGSFGAPGTVEVKFHDKTNTYVDGVLQ